MSKRRVVAGGSVYNRIIRRGKDGLTLLRNDIDQVRLDNQDNAYVLDFLLRMSKHIDKVYDALVELQEIGIEHKAERLMENGEFDDD